MKKTSIFILLALLAAFGPAANAKWILPEGSGTKNDPYLNMVTSAR